jgi:hypothetical protein
MLTARALFTHPPPDTHMPSIRTMRDRATLYKRIQELGPQFQLVRVQLQGKAKNDIKALASYFIEKYDLELMDRLERRTFDGMVTWFCRSRVLAILDYEDQRKLSLPSTGPTDRPERAFAQTVEPKFDLFADEGGGESGMDSTHSDISGIGFPYWP